jgi:Ribbon-helix-helix protein, copG family
MAGLKKMEQARRTLIYLDQTVYDTVKWRAQAEGVSMADLIRRAVSEHLRRPARKAVRK